MKNILFVTALLLSFAGYAFGAAYTANTVTATGVTIYGGQSAASALAATGPLIKLSSKVSGLVRWEATNAATGLSTDYEIFTKHDTGSKIFGTAANTTSIYYKIVPAKTLGSTEVPIAETGTANDGSDFTSAGSWTAF